MILSELAKKGCRLFIAQEIEANMMQPTGAVKIILDNPFKTIVRYVFNDSIKDSKIDLIELEIKSMFSELMETVVKMEER